MVEWHVTPDYIVNNWTDELFNLMAEKLVERKTRELEMYRKLEVKPSTDGSGLSRMGNMVKVVKKNAD